MADAVRTSAPRENAAARRAGWSYTTFEPTRWGGEHSEANIVLRCRAHNSLAAEDDFGRDFVDQRRDSLAHEPFAGQRLGE
ncbi:MAG: hypothetical protein JW940_17620 [Polyangiaceae bacterium]|nr:hypothetical protein [Polyangiaceae bacterium]